MIPPKKNTWKSYYAKKGALSYCQCCNAIIHMTSKNEAGEFATWQNRAFDVPLSLMCTERRLQQHDLFWPFRSLSNMFILLGAAVFSLWWRPVSRKHSPLAERKSNIIQLGSLCSLLLTLSKLLELTSQTSASTEGLAQHLQSPLGSGVCPHELR